MIDRSPQASHEARLLVMEAGGRLRHVPRRALADALRPGDLVVANDAATLPASLTGTHVRTQFGIEVRLAGWEPLCFSEQATAGTFGQECPASGTRAPERVADFRAVVFGAGDYHVRTEDRPLPPELRRGDRLELGPLVATVSATLGHPRLISLHFHGSPDAIWAGLAGHGRPIQYAHIQAPLVLWNVWTAIAGPPVAFEPPSAGFALDWRTVKALHDRGIEFRTITHAAGISSTGDPDLDRRLPLEELYDVPARTAHAIEIARARGGRIVAVGTTVVRALEHAAAGDGRVHAGRGVATERIGPATRLQIVDVVLTGVHEPGTSHHELLRAFAEARELARAGAELAAFEYRLHEFGDSVLIERMDRA